MGGSESLGRRLAAIIGTMIRYAWMSRRRLRPRNLASVLVRADHLAQSVFRARFCYDFSYFTTSCRFFVESITGCYRGYEHSWRAPCVGWYSNVALPGRRKCFDTPLKKGKPCSGAQAPAPIRTYRPGYDAKCEDVPYILPGFGC